LLTRLILLSLAAALATIALKTVAWRMTGSVGLFSDAIESVVNFVAAAGALVAIRWATRPPDKEHMYGHEKAEYFAAAAEESGCWLRPLCSSRLCWRRPFSICS